MDRIEPRLLKLRLTRTEKRALHMNADRGSRCLPNKMLELLLAKGWVEPNEPGAFNYRPDFIEIKHVFTEAGYEALNAVRAQDLRAKGLIDDKGFFTERRTKL